MADLGAPKIGRASSPEGMTEDELLRGITDALTLGGWRWMHIIRSDHVTQGSIGFPDVIACHPERGIVLAWEMKRERGPVTPDQWGWILSMNERRIDARIVRPKDYDEALATILSPRS